METNGKNRFASQGVSIAQMMYVSKYKSHKIALFNSMKKEQPCAYLRNIGFEREERKRKRRGERKRSKWQERESNIWRNSLVRRRSGQSVTASDFGSNGPRFESGRGRCVESLDKALYSHCPKEKPSH